MKKSFMIGLFLVAIASIVVGTSNYSQSAELIPPEPKAIVFYK